MPASSSKASTATNSASTSTSSSSSADKSSISSPSSSKSASHSHAATSNNKPNNPSAPAKQNPGNKASTAPKRSKNKSRKYSNNSSTCSPYVSIGPCCGAPPPPPPMIYRPDRCCYEKVKGPFQNPIPTRYQRFLDNFKKKCCPPNRCSPPPLSCCPPKQTHCCDDVREYKVCRAELQRLREERWKEQERKAILEEKRRQEWMEQQYKTQLVDWEKAQAKCERDRERRKILLKQILCYRKELKNLKNEARRWRCQKEELMLQQQKEQEEIWVNEFTQREDERRWEEEKLKMIQENYLLNSQMVAHDTTDMKVPEFEELRRMFIPVEKGPKETFEYIVLEPKPDEEEMRRQAEQKMQCLMGLRDTHGIHLNLSDRAKKRTTIQLAMGPKLSSGEREQSCKILSTPGALCSSCCDDDSNPPNLLIPQCLKPLMQTLTYRVNEIDTPLLSMKTFECGGNDGESSNGKEVALESGPNFNGSRLYGTIVLPKGKALSPFYTQPFNVSF